MIAIELIRNDIKPLQMEVAISEALQRIEEFNVSHLPVVENGTFLGVVSENQLFDAPDENVSIANALLAVMPISVESTAHLFDAFEFFGENNLSILPVINEDKKYLGYIFPQDVLSVMGNMLSSKIPGGILVVEVDQHDYQLSQMAQIVESNDAKIIASFITSHPETTKLDVALRINRMDLTSIIQTFERYNYTIKAVYHKSLRDIDLDSRFENLMNYLNM